MGVDHQPWRPKSPAQSRKAGCRPPESACKRDDITWPRTGAGYRRTAFKITERSDGDHQNIATDDIAADHPSSDHVALVSQPIGEPFGPKRRKVSGRGQPDEQRGRDRTHGGDVREVLRGRLPADVVWRRPIASEVTPVDKQVRRRHYAAIRCRDDRSIVARPEQGVLAGRQPRGDPIDQAELPKVTDTDLSLAAFSCYGVTDIVGHPCIGRRSSHATRSSV
jgi:hypothetical protein